MQCSYCETEKRHARPARPSKPACHCISRATPPAAGTPRGTRRRPGAKSVQIPLHAHEEEAQIVVLVLVGVQDVGPVPVQKARDAGDDPFPVGTVNQKGCGVRHGLSL